MAANAFITGLDIRKLLRFGATGGFVCGVDYALLWAFQFVVPALAAVSLAYLTAVTVHFLLSRNWVFESRDPTLGRQLFRYALCVALCWLCTVSVFSLSQEFLTSNVYLAKAMTIPPTTLLGFYLMRRLVFAQ